MHTEVLRVEVYRCLQSWNASKKPKRDGWMEEYTAKQTRDHKNTVKCSLYNLGGGDMCVHCMILSTFSEVGLEKYKKKKKAPDMRWMGVPYDHWRGEAWKTLQFNQKNQYVLGTKIKKMVSKATAYRVIKRRKWGLQKNLEEESQRPGKGSPTPVEWALTGKLGQSGRTAGLSWWTRSRQLAVSACWHCPFIRPKFASLPLPRWSHRL